MACESKSNGVQKDDIKQRIDALLASDPALKRQVDAVGGIKVTAESEGAKVTFEKVYVAGGFPLMGQIQNKLREQGVTCVDPNEGARCASPPMLVCKGKFVGV